MIRGLLSAVVMRKYRKLQRILNVGFFGKLPPLRSCKREDMGSILIRQAGLLYPWVTFKVSRSVILWPSRPFCVTPKLGVKLAGKFLRLAEYSVSN